VYSELSHTLFLFSSFVEKHNVKNKLFKAGSAGTLLGGKFGRSAPPPNFLYFSFIINIPLFLNRNDRTIATIETIEIEVEFSTLDGINTAVDVAYPLSYLLCIQPQS
jgi:hypothetical protein